MERRAWPWKKKALDTDSSAQFNAESSPSSRINNQELVLCAIDYTNHSKPPEPVTPLQQAELKLKVLNEQLAASDELIQQHTKVADEAVRGWQKAEAEAASLRQQLDNEVLTRVILEDRLLHLDGAFKECMRQLQNAREEKDQKLHDTLVNKTRELEELHGEMQAKVSKMATELGKSLQERARMIKEAIEGRNRAEEKANVLQMRVEMAEKEQAKWKYQLEQLSKQLEIRNEELEFTKKTAEAASKQHLESLKNAARLEAECQRLRLLRKRLSGTANVAQMKLEVDILPVLGGGIQLSPSRRFTQQSMPSSFSDTLRELSDRLLDVEEENRSLKEALHVKDHELHSARMMCTETAMKLSAIQEQLGLKASRPHGIGHRSTRSALEGFTAYVAEGPHPSKEPSIACSTDDKNSVTGSNYSESWAFSLIAKLVQFEKRKETSNRELPIDFCSSNFMDDFVEMESLASRDSSGSCMVAEAHSDLEAVLKIKELEHNSVTELCTKLRDQLSHAEDELKTIRLETFATKAALSCIEKHLTSSNESEISLIDVLEEVRVDLSSNSRLLSSEHAESTYSLHLEPESPEVRDAHAWSPSGQSSCQSEEAFCQDVTMSSKKLAGFGSELSMAVRKVVHLLERLPELDGTQSLPNCHSLTDSHALSRNTKSRSPEFGSCVESLIMLCNGLLHGKVDTTDFLEEMAAALDWLVSHLFLLPDTSYMTPSTRRQLIWDRPSATLNNGLQINGNIHLKDEAICLTEGIAANVECVVEESKGVSSQQGDSAGLCFAETNKDHHMEERFTKLAKDIVESKLKIMSSEVEQLKSELETSRINAAEIQANLISALNGKQSLLNEAANLVSSKKLLESQLCDAREEIKKLDVKTEYLESRLKDEKECRRALEAVFKQHDLHPAGQTTAKARASNTFAEELTKSIITEQESVGHGDRISECQGTNPVLGDLEDLKGERGVYDQEQESSRLASTKTNLEQQRVHSSLREHLQGMSESSRSLIRQGYAETRREELEQDSIDMSCGDDDDDDDEERVLAACSPRDLIVRSPARFLRGRGSSGEPSSIGFSRFFSKKQAPQT